MTLPPYPPAPLPGFGRVPSLLHDPPQPFAAMTTQQSSPRLSEAPPSVNAPAHPCGSSSLAQQFLSLTCSPNPNFSHLHTFVWTLPLCYVCFVLFCPISNACMLPPVPCYAPCRKDKWAVGPNLHDQTQMQSAMFVTILHPEACTSKCKIVTYLFSLSMVCSTVYVHQLRFVASMGSFPFLTLMLWVVQLDWPCREQRR